MWRRLTNRWSLLREDPSSVGIVRLPPMHLLPKGGPETASQHEKDDYPLSELEYPWQRKLRFWSVIAGVGITYVLVFLEDYGEHEHIFSKVNVIHVIYALTTMTNTFQPQQLHRQFWLWMRKKLE
jgi:hypothetical protein